ncbi:MAG TPA: HD domain-containing protein [Solirubrobacteraceae bacterium]
METVSFKSMGQGTPEDYALLARLEARFNERLPERIIGSVEALRGSFTGYRVDRCEHSLQSATRALRDGRDEEYVVAALVHDIGDELAPHTHGEMTAAVMRPFLPPRLCWIVEHHAVFQMYHYGSRSGDDVNARERYRGHEWFDDCAEFCAKYDENCFDPGYETLPIDAFAPMVGRVFSEPRHLDRD